MTFVEAPWAKVPIELAMDEETTMAEMRVYVALDFLAGKRGWWYGSQDRLSEECGVAARTVRAAVQSLIARGFVTSERMGADHGTVLRYSIVARLRVTGKDLPLTHLPDRQGSAALLAENCRSQRQASASPYKEPQTSPQTSPQRSPPYPPVSGGGPPSPGEVIEIRAARAQRGSRRQRDLEAARETRPDLSGLVVPDCVRREQGTASCYEIAPDYPQAWCRPCRTAGVAEAVPP